MFQHAERMLFSHFRVYEGLLNIKSRGSEDWGPVNYTEVIVGTKRGRFAPYFIVLHRISSAYEYILN